MLGGGNRADSTLIDLNFSRTVIELTGTSIYRMVTEKMGTRRKFCVGLRFISRLTGAIQAAEQTSDLYVKLFLFLYPGCRTDFRSEREAIN
jgi:hypothetical protein